MTEETSLVQSGEMVKSRSFWDGFDSEDAEDTEVIEEADATEVKSKKSEKTISVDIKYNFTEQELKELSQNICEIDHDIDVLDSEIEGYKSLVSTKKKVMENLDSERRALSRKYRDGFENRSTVCVKNSNYETGMYEYYDFNTEELVKLEKMDGLFNKEDKY